MKELHPDLNLIELNLKSKQKQIKSLKLGNQHQFLLTKHKEIKTKTKKKSVSGFNLLLLLPLHTTPKFAKSTSTQQTQLPQHQIKSKSTISTLHNQLNPQVLNQHPQSTNSSNFSTKTNPQLKVNK